MRIACLQKSLASAKIRTESHIIIIRPQTWGAVLAIVTRLGLQLKKQFETRLPVGESGSAAVLANALEGPVEGKAEGSLPAGP